MKTRLGPVVALFASLVVGLPASGVTGIYGVVERVVFEPSAAAPERVQIWGAFALMERMTRAQGGVAEFEGQFFTNYVYQKPTRGYLYFTLPEVAANVENARREWKDLASIAGSRQAVAFGYSSRYDGQKMMRVRDAAAKPTDPDVYYTNVGVAKLPPTGGHAAVVADLLKQIDR